MNTKKLIVFFLLAFLPMVAIGLILNFALGTDDAFAASQTGMVIKLALTAACMLFPLVSVLLTQLIFKEPVLKGVGISFKVNIWWLIGWLLMPVMAFAVLGVTLLMPGAHWASDSETLQTALSQLPVNIGIGGILAITVISGMISGLTVNAIFAFGEEVAWRGFLMKEFKGMKFLTATLFIGIIWGLWHAPIILNGHNYPQHPVLGVFLMVVVCLLLTPMLMYFRQNSGSVIVPAIMHGTFNAVIGISNFMVTPANDLLYGGSGLAGFIVMLLVDICLFLYDKYISKEHIFTTVL